MAMSKLNDIALVSEQRKMHVATNGVRALLEHMLAKGYIKDATFSDADGYREIVAQPGIIGHAVFYEGSQKSDAPAFSHFTLRHGPEGFGLGYGPKGDRHFFMEFAGTPESDVTEEFLDRIHTITYLYPVVLVTKHNATRKR